MPKKSQWTRKRDKVAILGYTNHNFHAPWQDDTWDLWGLNDLHAAFEAYVPGIFKTDRVSWFQLHKPDHTGAYHGVRDPEHHKWMLAQTCPIYMWEPPEAIKAACRYPLLETLREFPRAYFNNSISWMIAHAIRMGYTTIGLWGVDMALDGVHGESEYSYQRPSVEYFIGLAEGRGIEVVIPKESELLKCGYLYGYDNSSNVRRKMVDRQQQLDAQEQETINAYEAIKRGHHQAIGSHQAWREILEALQGIEKEHPEVKPLIDDATPKVAEQAQREAQLAAEYHDCQRQLHEVRGAKNNNKHWLKNYFPGDGALQDLPRVDNAVLESEVLPPQSDGHKPVNRIRALVAQG